MNLSGSPIDFLFAFLGGIAMSFTPCVYPLIPVSIGYIGINSAGSRLKGFILSIVYVSGVAITYSLLGLLASLSGHLFGSLVSLPVVHIIVGVLILLFGLAMLELFHLRLPQPTKLFNHKKANYPSTFLLGLISGLVVSPCLSPALGAILAYLATKKHILYGMLLLVSFAYGMGMVLILAGTFGAVLMNLPKAGIWMAYVKKAFALILVVAGIYFIFIGIRG
jgi:thiol:disulfide interchange protein DsbD